jgi:hypothetical protein
VLRFDQRCMIQSCFDENSDSRVQRFDRLVRSGGWGGSEKWGMGRRMEWGGGRPVFLCSRPSLSFSLCPSTSRCLSSHHPPSHTHTHTPSPPETIPQVHGLLGMLGGSWDALPATTAVLAAGPGTEAEARALGLRAECVGEAAGSADRFAAALAGHCAGRRGVRVFTEF